jgi:tetratricopeptide (TPR) repeat protein
VALAFGLGVLAGACGGGAAGGRATSDVPPVDPVADAEPEELFRTAEAHAARGDHVRAEQYLAAAGARGYPEAKVVKALVQVCVASSRLRQALAYGEPYLTRHPDDWRLRFVLGAVKLGLGDLDAALGELRRVVEDAPAAPEPRYALGRLLHERRSDAAAARPHLEAYLRLAPEGPHAREVRALLESASPGSGAGSALPEAAPEASPGRMIVLERGPDAAATGAGAAASPSQASADGPAPTTAAPARPAHPRRPGGPS